MLLKEEESLTMLIMLNLWGVGLVFGPGGLNVVKVFPTRIVFIPAGDMLKMLNHLCQTLRHPKDLTSLAL